MTRWHRFDGQGAALLEPDGRVRVFVSDELADAIEAGEAAGMTADEVMNRLLDDAEQKLAQGTSPVERVDPPPLERERPVERLVPRDWPPYPDYS